MNNKNNKGRYLSPEHIKAYQTGIYKNLFRGIMEDPELSFEIRLNDEAMVYYHKDKILTIRSEQSNKKRVEMLDVKYYRSDKKPSVDIEDINNLKSLTIIRKYFSEAKWLVYKYKMGVEFTVQQDIALGNHSFDNKYLVVDMEWQFPQSGIKPDERISKTRIDLVIVDTEKNEKGFNDIYLAEVKVGTGAKDGPSGVLGHVKKTNEIIQKKEACDALVEDVRTIIRIKYELGIITGEWKDLVFAPKPKMMLILAYRGQKELAILSKENTYAIDASNKIGMEPPLSIMHNALITL